MAEKTGRKKIAQELKKVNLCTTVKPEIYNAILKIAEDRYMSVTKVVEILLTNPVTVKQLHDEDIDKAYNTFSPVDKLSI